MRAGLGVLFRPFRQFGQLHVSIGTHLRSFQGVTLYLSASTLIAVHQDRMCSNLALTEESDA
jgi:hypothetical protein